MLLLLLTALSAWASPDSCAESLRQALCTTTLGKYEIAFDWRKVSCGADSADYLPDLLLLRDELPAPLRPLFCGLKRVFLTDNIQSLAFSTVTMNHGEVDGAYLAIRKSAFAEGLTAAQMLTWKEQLNFGGKSEYPGADPALVRLDYQFNLQNPKLDALLYVVLHELGHVVDFWNGFSEAGKGWRELSWEGENVPKPQTSYLDKNKICFYRCQATIPASRAHALYSSLAASAFLSTYAGMSPREDFAEFWAWYLLKTYKAARFRVLTPGGAIDLDTAMETNPAIREKLEWVKRAWESPATKLELSR